MDGNLSTQAAASAPPGSHAIDLGEDDRTWVRRGLMTLVFGQMRASLAGNVMVGGAAAAVLWFSGIGPLIFVWYGAVLAMAAVRAWHMRLEAPLVAGLDMPGLRRVERGFALLMAGSGTVWGLLPWLGYHGEDAFVDFFSVAMLVGMTAGAVNAAAALPLALRAYILCSFTPFVLKSALIGGAVYWGGAVTIVFTMGVWFSYAAAAHRTVRTNLEVTRQNQRLAAALRDERDAVRTALRAKNLFLAGVTHDLRQPVHAIALHLRYLRSLRADELQPAVLARLCEPVDLALQTMSGQLTRLLELSRLEAGEVKPERRAVALAALLDTVAAQFAVQARSRGLRWRLRVSRGLEAKCVDSDARMLQSMVDNLVSNAVRYTRRGGVLVAVRRAGGQLRLQVFDTGAGFDAALVPELFIAYRRFDDRDRLGPEAGQGLGLALVHKQAELLQHVVQVSSVPGRGSCFSLRLPLATKA